MKGRITLKECCESQGGAAYQVVVKGKKKCFSCQAGSTRKKNDFFQSSQ